MLSVEHLVVAYGKHVALKDITINVEPGEMVAILGANGAGKSTLLNSIGAGLSPVSGAMSFNGEDLSSVPPHDLAQRGIALVPEGRGIFPTLTVEENLSLGALPARTKVSNTNWRETVVTLFPKLDARRNQVAGTMSGGEQQMVAIGRALMSAPDLLLLDEPSLGLAPIVCEEMFEALSHIRETGVAVSIVEQNAHATLDIADRAYLIQSGGILGSGTAEELKSDPDVIRAFLGGG